MKRLSIIIVALLSLTFAKGAEQNKQDAHSQKVIIAYVTARGEVLPDPSLMTHINYAFGHVNESFNGVRIANEERLRQICGLKQQAPELKILLSIGGWGSGRFSEMAAKRALRKQFAADCQRVVVEFSLDGIDLDWEYPTSSVAKISSSPKDTKNFTRLMKAIRKAIGKEKLLTLASAASAKFVDFKSIDSYINFVNIMAYDLGEVPRHHSALFRSENAGASTSEEAVLAHLKVGIPRHKLVLGMPFYGRGGNGLPRSMNYTRINALEGYEKRWDEKARVPYIVNENGEFVCGYEDARSLAIKCQYILDQGLLGGMYWEYNSDNASNDLAKTVYNGLTK